MNGASGKPTKARSAGLLGGGYRRSPAEGGRSRTARRLPSFPFIRQEARPIHAAEARSHKRARGLVGREVNCARRADIHAEDRSESGPDCVKTRTFMGGQARQRRA